MAKHQTKNPPIKDHPGQQVIPAPAQADSTLANGAAVGSVETPGDSPVPPPLDPAASAKGRGPRKRVLGDGEGDYCIYEIAPNDERNLPRGTLLPIPNVPRFTDTTKAMQWIRNESGDLLIGKQVMVFQAREILSLQVQTKPQVVIQSKAKIAIKEASDE